jgi:hypothetical protein
VAQLEEKLETEKNARLEERFGWILASVIVFDVFAFYLMSTWTAPLIIGIFQLLGLTVLANRLGIDEVLPILDKLTAMITKRLDS